MPDAQDIVLCSNLCRLNPADPTTSIRNYDVRSFRNMLGMLKLRTDRRLTQR